MTITDRIIKWLSPKKTSPKTKLLNIKKGITSIILRYSKTLPCLTSLPSQLNKIESYVEQTFSIEQEDSFMKMINAYIELFKKIELFLKKYPEDTTHTTTERNSKIFSTSEEQEQYQKISQLVDIITHNYGLFIDFTENRQYLKTLKKELDKQEKEVAALHNKS